MRAPAALLILCLAAACGRYGFDPIEAIEHDGGAPIDASGELIDGTPLVRETWTLGEAPGVTVSDVTADTLMCDFAPGDDELNWGANERFEGGVFCTGLLRFELTALPDDANVVDASIAVWPQLIPSVAGRVDVYRVTEAWAEGTENGAVGEASFLRRLPGVEWTTPGGRPPGSADPAAVHAFNPTVFEAQVIPLPTAVVQPWIDTPDTNNGLAFVGFDYGNPDSEHPHFLSSEAAEAAMRPVLTITFDHTPPR